MDFPMYVDRIRMELPILCFKGPQGVHYNHCVGPSIRLSDRLWSVSENAHNFWTTWYILIKFCIHMHVNIV